MYKVLCLLIIIGCNYKKPNVKYERSNHTIKDLNGNNLREVSVMEKNVLGSASCTINYYKKPNAIGRDYINLDHPDTTSFVLSNTLNCELRQGNSYVVTMSFLGQSDTIEIIW